MTRQQLSLRAVFVFLMLLTCALGLPFLVRNEVIWSELNWVLLAGTISLSLALFLHSVVVASFRDAVALFAAAVVTGFAMELLGLHFGVPFLVHYEYHTDLQPQVGGVPLFIPLSWYALASVPVVLMRGMRLTSSLLRSSRVFLKSAVCAVFLVGADLLLDPLAVSVDAWRWVPEGPYFGVPVANYFGWFTVGMIIYYVFFSFHSGAVTAAARPMDDALMWPVAALSLMALVVIGIRLRHWLPIALFVAVTAPYWIFWLRQRRSSCGGSEGRVRAADGERR